ncbi:MAG: threonine/serine exporter family protein [Hominilimicola sp.]
MELERLLDFSAGIGRELLESGAETSRVEDTLRRIIRHFYRGHSEIFVVLTGFFVNIGTCTTTVRVGKRTINLDKVSKINMLSRDIVDGKIGFDEAEKRLCEIKRRQPYSLWLKTAAVAVCCSFFTLLESGNPADSLNSFIVGAVLNVITWFLRKNHTADFIITFTGGVMIAVMTVLLYAAGLGSNINAMITGTIMPLVPGLGITNALRDIIAGDYLSGGARMFDAIVVAVALAAGAGSVMYMIGYMSGGKLL